jgi:hypothetical protein
MESKGVLVAREGWNNQLVMKTRIMIYRIN